MQGKILNFYLLYYFSNPIIFFKLSEGTNAFLVHLAQAHPKSINSILGEVSDSSNSLWDSKIRTDYIGLEVGRPDRKLSNSIRQSGNRTYSSWYPWHLNIFVYFEDGWSQAVLTQEIRTISGDSQLAELDNLILGSAMQSCSNPAVLGPHRWCLPGGRRYMVLEVKFLSLHMPSMCPDTWAISPFSDTVKGAATFTGMVRVGE